MITSFTRPRRHPKRHTEDHIRFLRPQFIGDETPVELLYAAKVKGIGDLTGKHFKQRFEVFSLSEQPFRTSIGEVAIRDICQLPKVSFCEHASAFSDAHALLERASHLYLQLISIIESNTLRPICQRKSPLWKQNRDMPRNTYPCFQGSVDISLPALIRSFDTISLLSNSESPVSIPYWFD